MTYETGDPSNLRLSRGEYWLLETAVEYSIPLSCLLPRTCTVEELFNKPGHGLSEPQLVEILHRLSLEGLTWISESPSAEPPPGVGEILIAVRSNSRGDEAFRYGLTPLGGTIWETFAVPNWNRFLSEDFEHETGIVRSPSRRHLEGYLKYLSLDLMPQSIDLDSIVIEELAEWEPTYWKKLPHGFEAHFKSNRIEAGQLSYQGLEWLAFVGLCEYRDKWYRWQ